MFDHWFEDPYLDERSPVFYDAEAWEGLYPEHATFENYGPSDLGRVWDWGPQRVFEGDELEEAA